MIMWIWVSCCIISIGWFMNLVGAAIIGYEEWGKRNRSSILMLIPWATFISSLLMVTVNGSRGVLSEMRSIIESFMVDDGLILGFEMEEDE